MTSHGDDPRALLLAALAAGFAWCGPSPAGSQEVRRHEHPEAALSLASSPADAVVTSQPRTAAAFGELSLRAPMVEEQPPPAAAPMFKLDPKLLTLRSWRRALGPWGEVAAALAAKPKVVLIATTPDERHGTRLTLQCYPPRCGALVLARF